ncbi:GMC family oxidoreductase [Subtercola endophyticus]|uniref:GMC family oxidoreductase n=1 Tax=Subtercola endophyticus TaxID=2895559 RepID=UPI001E5139BF|nr:GMC family oxidoreductase [Subtercola endophyticus]UFS58672.1 GMC family oxidoreductase [Subtercola endophyticus]
MHETADVVIVGAGPSGAVAALRLAQAGLDVLCLEQGDWPPQSGVGASQQWELAGRGPAHFSPNRRATPTDFAIDDRDSDIDVLNYTGVGGGTVLWGAQWERFLPSDFRVRTLDGVADDWPLSFDDFAPYYARLDRQFGVAAEPGDPAFPLGGDAPYPALPIMPLGEKIARAHNRLGWHWWPGPNAVGTPEQMADARANGYPPSLRARVGDTHWPLAVAAGANLRTGAAVQRVLLDRADHATGVLWRSRDGREHTVAAGTVLLAAGGIGTPRLLLASAGAEHPQGLGNSSGLVGRRLMLHPFTRVVGLFDEPFDEVQGYWGQLVHSLEFAETDRSRGFVRGTKWNLGQGFGPVVAALHPWPDAQSWGPAVAEHVRRWSGRAGIWGITADDLPDENNRVELDPVRCAADGLPVPVIRYTAPADALRALAYSTERAAESMREAGATEVLTTGPLRGFGWHQLGTARMGDDSASSVVTSEGRLHDVPNVLVIDASVFVTGSSLNPTLTSSAFALRAAERMLA